MYEVRQIIFKIRSLTVWRCDHQHAFGIVVPDLPGCFSAGHSLDEAMAQEREAILLHLEGMLDEGKAPPLPGPVDMQAGNPDLKGWNWAFVKCQS